MLKANDTLIPGIDFTIGGEVYTAPPLNLGGIRAVAPRLGPGPECMSAVLTVALKRNYPEVNQPWLEETMQGMEFRKNKPLFVELLNISGLGPTETPSGEAEAAA